MKYKVGDKVRVESLEWYNRNKNENGRIDCNESVFFEANMSKLCGSIVTIKNIDVDIDAYKVEENSYYWTDEMFEGLAKDTIQPIVFENIVADKVELCLGDDYEIVVEDGRTFVQKKKPKYPTTYEECRKVLGIDEEMIVQGGWYRHGFIRNFYKLLICRDAYWKIAGNWKPDYDNIHQEKWGTTKKFALPFPNKEVLDAFNENFNDLVQKCENYYE